MASTLLHLPQELIVRVASHLTTPELGGFRRSCKHVEKALFDSFAQEFFTKRQFMIEHESLEVLLGIANHPGLASRLTEVIISTHHFYMTPDLSHKRIANGHVDRDMLLETGLARDLLAETFAKLPRLSTVGLRDYNGAGRAREGPEARWRSWGWSLAAYRTTEATTLFPLLLSALGAAKARPRKIEVFLRRPPYLTCSSFLLPSKLVNGNITAVLKSLETLMLAIGQPMMADRHDLFAASGDVYQMNEENSDGLKRMLHDTSSLKALRLNVKSASPLGAHILQWLGKSPSSYSPGSLELGVQEIPPVALDSLTTLELGMTQVAGPILVQVLTRFNLHSISLWRITLQCSGYNNVSKDCWSEFLSQISKALPHSNRVRTVTIGHPSQCSSPKFNESLNIVDVTFVPHGTASEDKDKVQRVDQVSFQAQFVAQNAKQWLQELSERTFLPGIHSTLEAESSMDELSDEDMDDLEDDPDHDLDDDQDDDFEDDAGI